MAVDSCRVQVLVQSTVVNLQKASELKLVREQLEDANTRVVELQTFVHTLYTETRTRYKMDHLWLKKHRTKVAGKDRVDREIRQIIDGFHVLLKSLPTAHPKTGDTTFYNKKPRSTYNFGVINVHLKDKISNVFLQELEALSALYQIVMEDVKGSKS